MKAKPFASQIQFAVGKINCVCHDCSETRWGRFINKPNSVVPNGKKLVTNRIKAILTIKSLVHTVIHAKRSVYFGYSLLECSQRRRKRRPKPDDFGRNIVCSQRKRNIQ